MAFCVLNLALWTWSIVFWFGFVSDKVGIDIDSGYIDFTWYYGVAPWTGWRINQTIEDRSFGFIMPKAWRWSPVNLGDDVYEVLIPFWCPLLLTAIPTAWLWHRDRRRIRPGCCLRCGYDLTGNTSGVCSECGLTKPPPATV